MVIQCYFILMVAMTKRCVVTNFLKSAFVRNLSVIFKCCQSMNHVLFDIIALRINIIILIDDS